MKAPVFRFPSSTGSTASKSATRNAVRKRLAAAAFAAVGAVALVAAGCGSGTAAAVGTWQGEINDQGETAGLTLELALEEGELVGEGVIEDDSGEGVPLEVTGGEATGGEVTVEIQDAFGGGSLQGELTGELSGDTIAGEGRVFSTDSSDESPTFELTRTEG